MKRLLERVGIGALVAAFLLFPFAMWALVLTGNLDMSGPMDDPYMSSDAPPIERAVARSVGFGLWTIASLTVMFLLVRDRLRRK